jgi:hypothetical protein
MLSNEFLKENQISQSIPEIGTLRKWGWGIECGEFAHHKIRWLVFFFPAC